MSERPFKLIGELINNSFARARRAWRKRNLAAYQKLARLQTKLGADMLTVNIDGTQKLSVRPEEMFAFLPKLVPALQASTPLPLAFDNPGIEFHIEALKHFDPAKGARPVINSVAASRERLDDMIALIREHDTQVIVMASEKFNDDGSSAQCLCAEDVHQSARVFVQRLVDEAGRTPDQILIDPGLAPVGADTYGLVNISLDSIRLIRQDADLAGVHISVGLTNFSFGTPKDLRLDLENAYITLAVEAGLDFVLGSPEKDLHLLDPSHPVLKQVRVALDAGRPTDGETQEDAGFRQAEKILELFV